MTDEQIIKYWNEIDSEIINEHGEEFDVYITMPVAKSTVDIINRQKAEIERLKRDIAIHEHVHEESNAAYQVLVKQAKSEAIKEFAERLKRTSIDLEIGDDKKFKMTVVSTVAIDSLVKEMTEVETNQRKEDEKNG